MTPNGVTAEPKPSEVKEEQDNTKTMPSLSDVFFNGGRGAIDLSMSKSEHNPRKFNRRVSQTTNKQTSHRNSNGLVGASEHGALKSPRRYNSSNPLSKRLPHPSEKRKSINDASPIGGSDKPSPTEELGPVISVSRRRSGVSHGVRRSRMSRTEGGVRLSATAKPGDQDQTTDRCSPVDEKEGETRTSSNERIESEPSTTTSKGLESPIKQSRRRDDDRGRTSKRNSEINRDEGPKMRPLSCDGHTRMIQESEVDSSLSASKELSHVRRKSHSTERRRHRRSFEDRKSNCHSSKERTRSIRHHESSQAAWTTNLRRMKKGTTSKGDETPPPLNVSDHGDQLQEKTQYHHQQLIDQCGDTDKSSHTQGEFERITSASPGGTRLVQPAIPRLRRRVDNDYTLPKTSEDKGYHQQDSGSATSPINDIPKIAACSVQEELLPPNQSQRIGSKGGDAADVTTATDMSTFHSRLMDTRTTLDQTLRQDRGKEMNGKRTAQAHEEDSVFDSVFLATRNKINFDQLTRDQKEESSRHMFDNSVILALLSPHVRGSDQKSISNSKSLPSSPTSGKRNKDNNNTTLDDMFSDLPFSSLDNHEVYFEPEDHVTKFGVEGIPNGTKAIDFSTTFMSVIKDRPVIGSKYAIGELLPSSFDYDIVFDAISTSVQDKSNCVERQSPANNLRVDNTVNLPVASAFSPTVKPVMIPLQSSRCPDATFSLSTYALTSPTGVAGGKEIKNVNEKFANLDLNITSHGGKKKGLKKLLGKSKRFSMLIDGGDSVCLEDLQVSNDKQLEKSIPPMKSTHLSLDKTLRKANDDIPANFNDSGLLSFSMDLAMPESKQQTFSLLSSQPSRRKLFSRTTTSFQTFDDFGLISHPTVARELPKERGHDMLKVEHTATKKEELLNFSNKFANNTFGDDFDLTAHLDGYDKKKYTLDAIDNETKGVGNGCVALGAGSKQSYQEKKLASRDASNSTSSGNLSWNVANAADTSKLDHLLSQSSHCKPSNLPDPSICPAPKAFVLDRIGKLDNLLGQSEHQKFLHLAEPSLCESLEDRERFVGRTANSTSALTIVAETHQTDEDDKDSMAGEGEDIENLSTASLSPDQDILNPLPGGCEGSSDQDGFRRTSLTRYHSDASILEQSFMTLDQQQQFLQLNLPGMDGYKSSSSLAVVEHTFDVLNDHI